MIRKTLSTGGSAPSSQQWGGLVLMVAIFTVIIGTMMYSFYYGMRMTRVYAPLIDAAMEIKLEATTAHLWFEEILNGDTSETMASVWEHQHQAEWYAKAMLHGGSNEEGTFIALGDPVLRTKIMGVIVKLEEFKNITLERFSTINVSGSGTAIDQKYDTVFKALLTDADNVETELQRVITQGNTVFKWTQVVIILAVFSVLLFASYFYRKTDLFRLKSLRLLREKNEALEQEIAVREQSEVRLLASENRYSRLVDSLNDVIFRISIPKGKFEFVSDSVEKLLGITVAKLCESPDHFKQRIHPDWVEEFDHLWPKLIQGEVLPFWEYQIQTGNSGQTKWISQRNSLVFDEEGSPVAVEGFISDITSRKNTEQERLALERQMLHTQKLESLGVLAGGIAHDFNNILMAILGNADLALMVLSPHAPARENVIAIEKATRRAAALSKQMLAYSGKGQFVIERIRLNEFVQEMSHILEVSLSKKAVLKFNFAENLPVFRGDPVQIRQVIMNLITNASEAIEEVSGVIAISTGAMLCKRDYLETTEYINPGEQHSQCAEGVYVYFEVADTGVGMDLETRQKMFEPFFTTKFTGRGLGMAAVQGILRGHNALIKVYSEVGKGSTFKILFPVSRDSEIDEENEVVSEDSDLIGQGTILIADDEETVCAVGKMMLEKFGFDVLTAADGREAVEVFRQNSDIISCVILDLTMPHLDGNEVFREMRLLKPDTKVILSSGYNEQDTTQQFAGKGLAGFIQKPYTSNELQAMLTEVLQIGS